MIRGCVLAALLAALLAPTLAAQDQPQLSATEARMVDAINDYRARYDLQPLSPHPCLMQIARDRAPYFSHTLRGRWVWQDAPRYGYSGFCTDNLAQGYTSPEDAVQGWATSSGHARQMRGYFKMNGAWRNYDFKYVGVARHGRNWIAVFGRSSGKNANADSGSMLEGRSDALREDHQNFSRRAAGAGCSAPACQGNRCRFRPRSRR